MQGEEPPEPWRPEAYAGIRNFMPVSDEMMARLRPVYQGIAMEASTTTD
jgi:hypothetical protein